MKLSNHADIETIIETTTVTLETVNGNIPLTFRSMPLTWDLECERELPSPDDPDDKHAVAICNRMQAVKLMLDSLEPGQIEFETKRSDHPSPAEYYEAVLAEMSSFGFSMDDIRDINVGISRLH
jgi:hypothetical protein